MDLTPALASGLEIAIIVLGAILIRLVVVKIVKRLVREARKPPHERSRFRRSAIGVVAWGGEREAQRSAALGSLVISITSVVVTVFGILGIFSVLGLNLTPVLASAGVLGVVLGFGAQNLVKDLISGVGMLLEDQFGVGDVIDMDKASGTVEAIGLRVTRLRDPAGVIWYVRNGEVLRVGNKSKGFSEILLDLQSTPTPIWPRPRIWCPRWCTVSPTIQRSPINSCNRPPWSGSSRSRAAESRCGSTAPRSPTVMSPSNANSATGSRSPSTRRGSG